MTRRLLFVSHSGELGGAELMLLDVARHHRARSHVVLLADGPFRARLEACGVPVSVMAGARSMMTVRRQAKGMAAARAVPATLATAWRLARMARGYDVVYPNSQKAAVVAMVAGLLARRPVVWHLHDIMSADHFGGLQRAAVVGLANLAARRVIANSGATRDAFVACGGRLNRVGIVPNGIDAAAFGGERGVGAGAIDVPAGKLIGMFGRIAPWKGQHVLIDALPAMPGMHAAFVGEALFGESAYREELLARVQALGLGDRVHWLGFRDDVADLMARMDVVVHTSTAPEPFGRVIVEAMLARRPIVASAHGASAEVLGSDYPYLIRPGDPAALSEAVTRLLAADPAQSRAILEANHARAVRLFSIDEMLRGIDRELALAG